MTNFLGSPQGGDGVGGAEGDLDDDAPHDVTSSFSQVWVKTECKKLYPVIVKKYIYRKSI